MKFSQVLLSNHSQTPMPTYVYYYKWHDWLTDYIYDLTDLLQRHIIKKQKRNSQELYLLYQFRNFLFNKPL